MKKLIFFFLVLQIHIYGMENEIPQETWKIKKELQHSTNVKSATYNEPSKQIYILDEKNVTLINIDNEKQSVVLPHFSNCWKPSCDPSGRYIITSPNEATIILSSTEGKEIARISIAPENFTKIVKFDHQGNQILIAGKNTVQLRNLDGTLITGCSLASGWIKIAKFFPHNDNLIFLARLNSSKAPKLWDVRNKNLIPYNYIDRLKKVNIHKDGTYLACTRENHKASFIYDLRKQGEAPLLCDEHPQSAKFNAAGTHILTKYDYLALLWKMQCVTECINTQKYVDFNVKFNSKNLWGATFHPDGNRILTYSTKDIFNSENNFSIWDLDGKQLAKLPHGKKIYSAKYDPKGNYIISRHEDNIVTVWQKTE